MPDIALGEPDEQYWRGLAGGAVRVPRCSSCAEWVWPVQPVCPRCHTESLVWTEVDPIGTVFSWTRTWYPFAAERSATTPYIVVVAEVPGAGGTRLLGVLSGSDVALAIGANVRGLITAPSPATLGLHALCWELID